MPQLLSKSHCTWHRRPVQGPVTPRRFGPVSGGAITGVLPGTSSRLPPAPCRWSHNWRATRHHHPPAATGPVPVEPQLACYKAPSSRLPPAPCRWSHNGRAIRHIIQAATGPVPVEPQLACYRHIIQAATGPVPVEPQLACYQAHHPGCHRPRAGGATTGVLQSAREVRRRSRRWVSNAPARNRDRNPPAARRPSAPGQVAG